MERKSQSKAGKVCGMKIPWHVELLDEGSAEIAQALHQQESSRPTICTQGHIGRRFF